MYVIHLSQHATARTRSRTISIRIYVNTPPLLSNSLIPRTLKALLGLLNLLFDLLLQLKQLTPPHISLCHAYRSSPLAHQVRILKLEITTIHDGRKRLEFADLLNLLEVLVVRPSADVVRLPTKHGQAVCDFCFDAVADNLGYSCRGGGDGRDFVAELRDLDVDEVGEGGVEEPGQDGCEGGRVDDVACFVDEAAEGGRCGGRGGLRGGCHAGFGEDVVFLVGWGEQVGEPFAVAVQC